MLSKQALYCLSQTSILWWVSLCYLHTKMSNTLWCSSSPRCFNTSFFSVLEFELRAYTTQATPPALHYPFLTPLSQCFGSSCDFFYMILAYNTCLVLITLCRAGIFIGFYFIVFTFCTLRQNSPLMGCAPEVHPPRGRYKSSIKP
jgi:hypothetical protein